MTAEKVLELSNMGLNNMTAAIEGDTIKLVYIKDLFNQLIQLAQNDISTKLAKSKGGNTELKRKKIAELMFKKMEYRPALQGFKRYDDNKIAITDGLIAYYGEEIVGINETSEPDKYFDVPSFIKNARENMVEHSLKLSELKLKYTSDKSQAKAKGLKTTGKNANMFSVVKYDNTTEKQICFQTELLINACELLKITDDFIIKISNRGCSYAGYIQNETGEVIIMPCNPKTL